MDPADVTKTIFKTDEQVVSAALRLFKNESRFLVQEIACVGGGLSFGEVHVFSNLNELSHWVWDLPDTRMYVAVATRSGGTELTYRGLNFVIEYRNIKANPKTSYFKTLNSEIRFPVDLNHLDQNVEILNKQEKAAC